MKFDIDLWLIALLSSGADPTHDRDLLEVSGLIEPRSFEEGLAQLLREIDADLALKGE